MIGVVRTLRETNARLRELTGLLREAIEKWSGAPASTPSAGPSMPPPPRAPKTAADVHTFDPALDSGAALRHTGGRIADGRERTDGRARRAAARRRPDPDDDWR